MYCILFIVITSTITKTCISFQIPNVPITITKNHLAKTSNVHSKTKLNQSEDTSMTSNKELSRRQSLEVSIGGVGLGLSFLATRENKPTDYGLFGVLPVGPYKEKKSIFETIVPNQIWTVDQKFGILNVQVPIRMTVIKLKSGLFLYNPIAATPEVVTWLKNLCTSENTTIQSIVIGSVAAEHKVYASVLAQKFPKAKVWLTEGQYSFPANLPQSFLGFPSDRTSFLNPDGTGGEDSWSEELQYLTLGPFISRDGAFAESVFLHKPTQTLLCTDTVLEVTDEVPNIYDVDPHPLLFHARDTVTDVLQDTEEIRKLGYRRVVLFGLFFTPSAIVIKDVNTAFKERRPDINTDFIGIYPWDWVGDDVKSFKALQGGLLVAPILQKLILNRNPIAVLDFADTIPTWPIKRIIPSHLKNDLKYNGEDYRRAFDFLTVQGVKPGYPNPLKDDFKTLDDANVNLIESGAISVIPPFPGGIASRAEIIAQEAYGCRAGVCSPRPKP